MTVQASLGIDTSCYTTSVALVVGGMLTFDGRVPLEVSKGACGLKQSEALFQHVRNLPGLVEAAFEAARASSAGTRCMLVSIGASVWPRRVEGSYMPVFLASAGFGRACAASSGARLIELSHQEGHIAAARWSSKCRLPQRYLALHLSGGTTELLEVRDKFDIAILGGTDDLNAGQFVDRVGVAMGIPFPAGPGLEQLARSGQAGAVSIPVSRRGLGVSFSGPCSAALRKLEAGARREDLALAVFESIGESIGALAAAGMLKTGIRSLLVAGGVASNAFVGEIMAREITSRIPGAEVHLAEPEYARDSAVGAALLAWEDSVQDDGGVS